MIYVTDKEAANDYAGDLLALRILYNRVIAVLDAKIANGVVVDDRRLNGVYLSLMNRIVKILSKPELSSLKSQAPEIYDTIDGESEAIGEDWEHRRKYILNFYSLLQKELVAIGIGHEGVVDNEITTALEEIDLAIARHSRLTEAARENFNASVGRMAAVTYPPVSMAINATSAARPLTYDGKRGIAAIDGKTATLFSPSALEGFLMHRISSIDGDRITYADIATDFEAKHPELDKDVSLKALTNAKDRVNEKLKNEFGIYDAIEYQRGEFWLNAQYCSNSPS